jgi:hypothetical protein
VIISVQYLKNSGAGVRSQRIDTCYHFVREHMEDNFIKITFVKSDENIEDMLTKNVSKDIYVTHANEFLGRHDNSNL